MACVSPSGQLTVVAKQVLEALRDGGSAQDVAAVAGVPLFRARASLRELGQAGLVTEANGRYTLTDEGAAALS